MRIGIDLGGTKIEGVAIDDRGDVRTRRRVPTPADGYEEVLYAIRDLVVELEREIGTRASVGVGIPGSLSPATGLVQNANTTRLIGKPLDKDLETLLGRPVRVANDANCFSLAEASDGAGAPPRGALDRPWVVFGVIIGTGCGGGVVVDGKVLVGPNGIAGEWGHSPLPWQRDDERPGPLCYCGKHACIETFLSGPGLARDHAAHTNQSTPLRATDVAALAAAGDAGADATLRHYEDRLARGLATIVNALDPDVIVLGGGVSNIDRLYSNVPAQWGIYIFSDQVRTRLVRNQHGDSSGVRGAAWLWPLQQTP